MENPHQLIIHVATNDISTNKQPEQIAKSIVESALSVKSNTCDVTLSEITVRNDGHQQKVAEINRHLKELCKVNNNFLIQHDKTITTRHSNGSKLHLNKRSAEIISCTFIESISNIIHWQSILHSPDNYLIDEYNANLSSKQKFSILCKRNIDKIIVAHLNTNSLRNKFSGLWGQISGNIDILLVSKTKLDESFPLGQFIVL